MASKTSKVQSLKKLLICLLVIVALGGGGLFYVSLTEFQKYSLEVQHRLQDAKASGEQIEQLQSLKGQLDQSQQLTAKADQLFSTQDTYQTRALSDIRALAARAGLTIEGTEFEDADTQGNERTMTVRLASPVSFSKLVQFLDGIEGNLPKMQVASANLARVEGGNSDSVRVEDIKVKLLVR